MNTSGTNLGGRAVRALSVLGVVGVLILGLLLWGIPVYGRYQVRANAANEIQVNALRIQQTQQLVQVMRRALPGRSRSSMRR